MSDDFWLHVIVLGSLFNSNSVVLNVFFFIADVSCCFAAAAALFLLSELLKE